MIILKDKMMGKLFSFPAKIQRCFCVLKFNEFNWMRWLYSELGRHPDCWRSRGSQSFPAVLAVPEQYNKLQGDESVGAGPAHS